MIVSQGHKLCNNSHTSSPVGEGTWAPERDIYLRVLLSCTAEMKSLFEVLAYPEQKQSKNKSKH